MQKMYTHDILCFCGLITCGFGLAAANWDIWMRAGRQRARGSDCAVKIGTASAAVCLRETPQKWGRKWSVVEARQMFTVNTHTLLAFVLQLLQPHQALLHPTPALSVAANMMILMFMRRRVKLQVTHAFSAQTGT